MVQAQAALKIKSMAPIKKKGAVSIFTIMEKIKNMLKSVNKFGLLALMLVAFMAVAFKAPQKKTNTLLTEYGRDFEGNWTPVGTASPGTGTNQYTCEDSDEICRALFETPPTPNQAPEPENVIEADGEFVLH